MKKEGRAWMVERFVALIVVSYPIPGDVFPARAAETVKPIIDGGSDAKLWPDDDSAHRCSTVYIQSAETAPSEYYRLQVIIIPVSDKNPRYQIAGGLSKEIIKEWAQQANKPLWSDGYMVSFTVTDKHWITSNYTDSDLVARQRGAKRAATWGMGRSFGIRERVGKALEDTALTQWKMQPYCGYEKFIVIACVAYPYGVDRADPDNAAETVNCILKSGIRAGAWHDLTSKHCKGVAFIRLPNLRMGGRHVVKLMVMPVPDSFQIAAAIPQSASDAWAEHDRRLL
ncbi:hypothetical protein JS541_13210 [Bifidobacterium sp. SO1]|nr:hypothetical protein [Bifidobacterium sp. SO1]